MSNIVTIRSFPNGIKLRLDPSATFADIRRQTAEKFAQARAFFKDASVAVSYEGRMLTEIEEDLLVDAIINNSDLNVICICKEDPITQSLFSRAIKAAAGEGPSTFGEFSRPFYIYHGDLTDADVLTSHDNILVLGNVEAGCLIESSESIIVLGSLYGQANAGENSETEDIHFVFALDLQPKKLFIDGKRYTGQPRSSKWALRQKMPEPSIAFLQNDELVIEPAAAAYDKGFI